MSLSPSSTVSAKGVMIYSRQRCVNSISVYCYGSGESCLQNPSASFVRCWVRITSSSGTAFCSEHPSGLQCQVLVPFSARLLCTGPSFASSVGVFIPLSSPLVMLLSPAHLSAKQNLCDVVSLPTLTVPQQVFFPLLPSPFL